MGEGAEGDIWGWGEWEYELACRNQIKGSQSQYSKVYRNLLQSC